MGTPASRSGVVIPTGLPSDVEAELRKASASTDAKCDVATNINGSYEEYYQELLKQKQRQEPVTGPIDSDKSYSAQPAESEKKRGWRTVPSVEILDSRRRQYAESYWGKAGAVYDVEDQWESFKDYRFASARIDVDATWRNWVRRAAHIATKFQREKNHKVPKYTSKYETFFTKNYPRKIGKAPGFEAWRAAAQKEGGEEKLWDLIKKTLAWQINDDNFIEFTPSPERYLDDRRWEDIEPKD